MSEISLLVRIAFRNLFSSFLNIIIGGIIFIGTLVFVVGGSVMSSVDSSMSKSITGSIAGDIQVFSDKSKEQLALWSDWGYPDISAIPDFSKIKEPLLKVDNVKTVIPMAVDGASVMFGNTVDLALEKLRKAVNARIKGDKSKENDAKIDSLITHVQRMVGIIQTDYQKFAVMATQDAVDAENVKVLEKAASKAFWSSFKSDPLGHLEFLENRIANLIPDADFIFLSYVGTDLDAFKNNFDRMQIVDGQMVPTGKRGMMLSKYLYETQFKMKTAFRLDKIHEALTEKGQRIATDPDLQLMIKQNRTQTREVMLQLDPISAEKVTSGLQAVLKSDEKELPKLLASFFDTNDENFIVRYDHFYKEIAPNVELYRVRPGDILTIKAFTKSGYVQSANLKIYGTFQFKGLEKSGLAGGMSLMDLMSFRDLYGYVTPDKINETKGLKDAVGAKFVTRDQAEAELFGGASVMSDTKIAKIDDKKELANNKVKTFGGSLFEKVYSPAEIEQGVVLNAAVLLKDPSKLNRTIAAINDLSKKENVGVKAISWQAAAGNLGQFVFVAKAILYFAVFIIFVVALVIINNAVMMATLQRVREIGTMRAIGAQRSFVLSLILIETLCLGVVFGTAGTFLGAVIVKILGMKGIAAGNEFLYFFFSGPRLYVTLGLGSLVGAILIICIVASLSALYPAIVATRVSPLQAMQTED